MPLLLCDLLLMGTSFLTWYLPFFHPQRRGLRNTPLPHWAYPVMVGICQIPIYLAVTAVFGTSLTGLSIAKTLGFLCFLWWPFAAYPGQPFQNLFLLGITGLLCTVASGFGDATEMAMFESALWYARLGHFLAYAITSLLLLPAFMFGQKQLLQSWRDSSTAPFWRIIWLIPGGIFLLALSSGSVFSNAERISTASFLLTRLLLAVSMFTVLFAFSAVLAQAARSAMYAEKARLSEQQLRLQREQYTQLMQQTAQTHSLRREVQEQFTQLRAFAHSGNLDALQQALQHSLKTIPSEGEVRYCAHHAANALARHYLALAAQLGIHIDVALDIPKTVGEILDSDLCVIIGNCLENAIEANAHVPEDKRFLRMRARRHQGYLTIVLDNAFDGTCQTRDGMFLSRKRDEEGIGIPSVRAIAAKYQGEAAFTPKEEVFLSSVVLRYQTAGDDAAHPAGRGASSF